MALSKTIERSISLDLSNPIHLHHSDYSGSFLITKPLNGNNYSTCSRTMGIAHSAKNKMGFVDGTIKKPSPSNEDFLV